MIYVSTACVKQKKICDSVLELAINGFQYIELSGGTSLYDHLEGDLLQLKEDYNLNFLCHNYFPPPKQPFVLNLASLNNKTFQRSCQHLESVIDLSHRLGADKYGFHAGFFIDIRINEIGRKLTKDALFDEQAAVERFCKAFRLIQRKSKNVSLFIENNVLSDTNEKTFKGTNPFMMTNFSGYKDLKEKIDFNLLLDVAHLKVSAQSLKLDWQEEFRNMIQNSSYVHVSDNDGLHDSNSELIKNSELYHMLKENDTENKDFTLEVYDGMNALKRSYDVLSEAVS